MGKNKVTLSREEIATLEDIIRVVLKANHEEGDFGKIHPTVVLLLKKALILNQNYLSQDTYLLLPEGLKGLFPLMRKNNDE